jgi:hypothetical protein
MPLDSVKSGAPTEAGFAEFGIHTPTMVKPQRGGSAFKVLLYIHSYIYLHYGYVHFQPMHTQAHPKQAYVGRDIAEVSGAPYKKTKINIITKTDRCMWGEISPRLVRRPSKTNK